MKPIHSSPGLSADLLYPGKGLENGECSGADFIHIDVMDGVLFLQDLSVSRYWKYVAKLSKEAFGCTSDDFAPDNFIMKWKTLGCAHHECCISEACPHMHSVVQQRTAKRKMQPAVTPESQHCWQCLKDI